MRAFERALIMMTRTTLKADDVLMRTLVKTDPMPHDRRLTQVHSLHADAVQNLHAAYLNLTIECVD